MRQNGILVFIEKPFSISWETFLQPETSWESYELSQKIEKGFSIEKDIEKGFSIKKNIEKGFSIRKILRKFSDYLTVSHTTELRDSNDGSPSSSRSPASTSSHFDQIEWWFASRGVGFTAHIPRGLHLGQSEGSSVVVSLRDYRANR